MGYQQYGIPQELVEFVKAKLKNPDTKERVKQLLQGVTKSDLQDPAKVKKLVDATAKVIGTKISDQQTKNIVRFVIAQKIDPNNTFHLIKLWSMFR